jgi:putative FmdB family regulatory protein
MPVYEFSCQQCGKSFEVAFSIAEAERKRKEGVQCPACGRSEVVPQISHFQVKTSKKS